MSLRLDGREACFSDHTSHAQGCLSARGERILFLDADGATEIKDMQRLEKVLDGVTSDPNVPAVVVGSRSHLQDEAVAKVHVTMAILNQYPQ